MLRLPRPGKARRRPVLHGLRVPWGQRGAAALRVRGGGGAGQCEVVVVVLDAQAGVYRGVLPAAVAGAVPTDRVRTGRRRTRSGWRRPWSSWMRSV